MSGMQRRVGPGAALGTGRHPGSCMELFSVRQGLRMACSGPFVRSHMPYAVTCISCSHLHLLPPCLWSRYEDGGRVRPIIYRAALAEIIVPYGEPRVPYDRKCAYDIVDYGLVRKRGFEVLRF